MRTPRVAIVILNWNGRHHLAPCLDSVLELDYPRAALETIVVDNGSDDGSAEFMAAAYPWVRVLRNEENLGYARANNQGVAAALGADYAAILNNDTRVDPGWLRELVPYLEARPQVAVAGSLVLDWKGRKIDFAQSAMSPFGEGFQIGFGRSVKQAPSEPSRQLFVNGAGFVCRRDAYIAAGGFDERYFAYYEDVDFGWRLWLLGWEVMLVPASRVYHRHHGTRKRINPARIEVLFARNSLMSVIKNYEAETLERLLPVTLLANFKRLERMVAVEDELFRVSPRDVVFEFTRGLPRDVPPHFDPVAIFNRLRSGELSVRHLLAQRVIQAILPGGMVFPAQLASRLVAMSDILDIWPELLETRQMLQARRQRSDAEIEPLFRLDMQARKPPRGNHSAREYQEAWVRAAEAVGLHSLVPRG